jgi:hypothetical protein
MGIMYGRNANLALSTMTNSDSDVVVLVTERFERRLAEENGKLRVEMANGFGGLRAEMVERNAELLKWMLIFGVTQTAAIVGLIKLWR